MVGVIGAGMYHTAMLTRLVQDTDVDVVMLSGHYTLLEHRARDDLLPACAERGVSVLAASVFNSGLLAMPRPPKGRVSTTHRPHSRSCGGRIASPTSARHTA